MKLEFSDVDEVIEFVKDLKKGLNEELIFNLRSYYHNKTLTVIGCIRIYRAATGASLSQSRIDLKM